MRNRKKEDGFRLLFPSSFYYSEKKRMSWRRKMEDKVKK
jgi:hypothetical protein